MKHGKSCVPKLQSKAMHTVLCAQSAWHPPMQPTALYTSVFTPRLQLGKKKRHEGLWQIPQLIVSLSYPCFWVLRGDAVLEGS